MAEKCVGVSWQLFTIKVNKCHIYSNAFGSSNAYTFALDRESTRSAEKGPPNALTRYSSPHVTPFVEALRRSCGGGGTRKNGCVRAAARVARDDGRSWPQYPPRAPPPALPSTPST